MELIDDLLGPAPSPVAPLKKSRRRKTNGKKVDDLLGPANGKRKYQPLKPPRAPAPDGIFALKEAKGKNLGRTCLICKTELKHKKGRPPIICRKKSCFRDYRNAYRHDYDKVHPS